MNAASIVKALLSVGTTLHDAFVKAQEANKTLTLASFLSKVDVKSLGGEVTALLDALRDQGNAASAVAEIDKKQRALLGTRTMSQFSVEELIQYSALSRARLLLTTKRLEDAMSQDFLEWLVDDALPALMQVAPIVISLLL